MQTKIRKQTLNKHEQDEYSLWVLYEVRGDDPWIAIFENKSRAVVQRYADNLAKRRTA